MVSIVDRYIGSKITDLRVQDGRSVEDLSQTIGISAEKWRSYEAGEARVESADLSLISSIFGEGQNKLFPDFAINNHHETDILALRQEALKIINNINSCEVLTLVLTLLRPLPRS